MRNVICSIHKHEIAQTFSCLRNSSSGTNDEFSSEMGYGWAYSDTARPKVDNNGPQTNTSFSVPSFPPLPNEIFPLSNEMEIDEPDITQPPSAHLFANGISRGTASLIVGETPVTFECGHVARFADGAAVCHLGQTAVLVTAVSSSPSIDALTDFVPLTVDYRQKAAASGQLPANRLRRELGPSDSEILASRLIDRAVRPLFNKQLVYGETQLTCNSLAVDRSNDPVVTAINAASAALSLSDIPWAGPVGAVRMGLIQNDACVNPTRQMLKESSLDLVLAGTGHSSVVMLEGEADNVNITDLMKAVVLGLKEIKKIVTSIERLVVKHGKSKRALRAIPAIDPKIIELVMVRCDPEFEEILSNDTLDKIGRDTAFQRIQREVVEEISSDLAPDLIPLVRSAVNERWRICFRHRILSTKMRCDGRNLNDLRYIECQTHLHQPLHGSALFQRGQTQVLSTLSFDSLAASLKDYHPVEGLKEKHFMLHYSFPSYATNDISKGGAKNRRELGHGALAEKGLKSVIPEDYPFTLRLTSEVLESNGSSSMATVCSGSLALSDAGVPIKSLAGGVAIGLVTAALNESFTSSSTSQQGECDLVQDAIIATNQNTSKELASCNISDYAVLTDILGIEDYLGDMDFKIAGTKKGVTALQLDVKLEKGLPRGILLEALAAGQRAKNKILGIMAKHLNESPDQKRVRLNAPKSEMIDVPPSKRQRLLGSGGFRLKKVEAETGATFIQMDELKWQLFAPNSVAFEEAFQLIQDLLKDESKFMENLEFGAIYPARVLELRETGVMIELEAGLTPIFIPCSQLDVRRVRHPSMLDLNVGDEIFLKYFGRDPATGSLRLSRKVLQATTVTKRRTE